MKAAALRKLIGKPVVWDDTFCPKNGFISREGILLEVRGKNALVDQQGSTDWKWIPDMHGLKAKAAPDAAASAVRPTHWKDERGYTLTDAQREAGGSDWQHFYNVPCVVRGGQVRPLYPCGHCNGKGIDPECKFDPCPKCGKSGGAPAPLSPDALASSL